MIVPTVMLLVLNVLEGIMNCLEKRWIDGQPLYT